MPSIKHNGVDIVDTNGKKYLHFDFLPSQVSISLEAFRLEMYCGRLSPRCAARDLYIRMHPGPTDKIPSAKALNMQRRRFRDMMNLPCWHKRAEAPSQNDCLLHEQISWSSVLYNTCLPMTPDGVGFVKPVCPGYTRTGPPVIIPVLRYIGYDRNYTPSDRLMKLYDLIGKLQEAAQKKGYAHWIFLENAHKPAAWSEAASKKGFPRSGPNEISIPRPHSLPRAALKHIEKCIRDSTLGAGFQPDPAKLSPDIAAWVQSCAVKAWKHAPPALWTAAQTKLISDNADTVNSAQANWSDPDPASACSTSYQTFGTEGPGEVDFDFPDPVSATSADQETFTAVEPDEPDWTFLAQALTDSINQETPQPPISTENDQYPVDPRLWEAGYRFAE